MLFIVFNTLILFTHTFTYFYFIHISYIFLPLCHYIYVSRVGGGGIEARPGTEKRCSHNLQSGPVKTWTAVFVIINIPIDDQLI